ncbi:MAG TPA: cupredoxin domain-containing protein [Candidatus Paceibacterota bacterium]
MKNTIIAVVVAGLVIWLAISYSGNTSSPTVALANNVYLESGKQIVEIEARGGYTPAVSTASSSIPTILRMKTNGTFDCSSFVVIPVLNVQKILPQTGITDIDLGTPSSGTLNGTCTMGMYRFVINFD